MLTRAPCGTDTDAWVVPLLRTGWAARGARDALCDQDRLPGRPSPARRSVIIRTSSCNSPPRKTVPSLPVVPHSGSPGSRDAWPGGSSAAIPHPGPRRLLLSEQTVRSENSCLTVNSSATTEPRSPAREGTGDMAPQGRGLPVRVNLPPRHPVEDLPCWTAQHFLGVLPPGSSGPHELLGAGR